jgi:hypothetical protein
LLERGLGRSEDALPTARPFYRPAEMPAPIRTGTSSPAR